MNRIHYPIMLDITGRLCLVVGGGEVALRKARALLACGARVAVVAPKMDPRITDLGGAVEVRHRACTPADLDGCYLVIAASDQADVNTQVYREAQARGILVNVVDDPQHCTFLVPSVLRRGRITVAISTSGASPALAAHLRRKLEGVIGPEYGRLADLLARLRPQVLRQVGDPQLRRRVWQAILASEVLDLLRRQETDRAEEKALECISIAASADPTNPSPLLDALRQRFQEVQASELRRFRKRLARLSEKDRALVEELTDSVVEALLHALPLHEDLPPDQIQLLRDLFDLNLPDSEQAPRP